MNPLTNPIQTIIPPPQEKPVAEKPVVESATSSRMKFSFTLTYILLLTTATITFIEAIRTQNPMVRHVLNLETCISVVAGYFYSSFVSQISKSESEKTPIDWASLSKTRYLDWAITTPMMLLALCTVLSNEIGQHVHLRTILLIVVLNYAMLYIGYLGETGILSRIVAMVGGFVPFGIMYYLIYRTFVRPKKSMPNRVLFGIYLVVWSCYGIVYMLNESNKNIAMNILDLTAKCMIGIGLWVYYTKIVQ
jgi:bacteriorhodopsin